MIALGAVLTWLAFMLGTVTASVIVALIVAATFAPLGRSLRRRGWSGSASAAAVTGAAVLVGGLLLVLLALAFVPLIPVVVANVQSGIESIKRSVAAIRLAGAGRAVRDRRAQTSQAWIRENLAVLVGSVANVVTIGLLALFLTFFLLQDGEKGWGRAMR